MKNLCPALNPKETISLDIKRTNSPTRLEVSRGELFAGPAPLVDRRHRYAITGSASPQDRAVELNVRAGARKSAPLADMLFKLSAAMKAWHLAKGQAYLLHTR